MFFFKLASFTHLFCLHLRLTQGSHCLQSNFNFFFVLLELCDFYVSNTQREKRKHSSHQCSLMEGITLHTHPVKMKGHSNI